MRHNSNYAEPDVPPRGWRQELALARPFFWGLGCVFVSVIVEYFAITSDKWAFVGFCFALGLLATGAGLLAWGYVRARAWKVALQIVLIILVLGMAGGLIHLF